MSDLYGWVIVMVVLTRPSSYATPYRAIHTKNAKMVIAVGDGIPHTLLALILW